MEGGAFRHWAEQSVNMQGWALLYWNELSLKHATVKGRSLLGLTIGPSHAYIVHTFF